MAAVTQTDEAALDSLPAVLTVPEIAKVLRCDKSTVYEMIRRGEIDAVRLGRVIRIPADELRRFLDA